MTERVYEQKYFSVITTGSNWGIFTKNYVFLKDKMELRMKNFNILGFHWEIQLLEGGFMVHEQPI